ALAPNYDLTLSPRITSKQGLLMQGEFRQRLDNGFYTIRAAGIDQLDKDFFVGQPGNRNFRGSFETEGKFNLTSNWTWGWDTLLGTDQTSFQDYKLATLQTPNPDPFGVALTDGISQLWLTGRGTDSYFEARAMHFYGFSTSDVQAQLPVIAPVIDYNKVFD